MEVQVTSNMDSVLDAAPYNDHTVKCNVTLELFAHISGILMFSFIKEGISLLNENQSFSQPGPLIAMNTVSESLEGMSQHICNVTLIVGENVIDSKMNGTTVEVLGK